MTTFLHLLLADGPGRTAGSIHACCACPDLLAGNINLPVYQHHLYMCVVQRPSAQSASRKYFIGKGEEYPVHSMNKGLVSMKSDGFYLCDGGNQLSSMFHL